MPQRVLSYVDCQSNRRRADALAPHEPKRAQALHRKIADDPIRVIKHPASTFEKLSARRAWFRFSAKRSQLRFRQLAAMQVGNEPVCAARDVRQMEAHRRDSRGR